MKRISMMLVGNIVIGFGISLGVLANLGIDPGMTFFYGISNITNLSLGSTTALCNILFLLPLIIFDRKRIGIATIVNMLFMGFIVEFFTQYVFQGVLLQLGMMNYMIMILGICLQSFGVVLYSSVNMGQSPLDGIPNVIIKVTGKFNYRIIRIVQDSSLVLIGFLCGVKIGIGTVMLMCLVGPCIHFFQNKLSSLHLINQNVIEENI